jgi:hypothetical protein
MLATFTLTTTYPTTIHSNNDISTQQLSDMVYKLFYSTLFLLAKYERKHPQGAPLPT